MSAEIRFKAVDAMSDYIAEYGIDDVITLLSDLLRDLDTKESNEVADKLDEIDSI